MVIGNLLEFVPISDMESKQFKSLEDLEQWLEDNPDEVGRHILEGWRYMLENEIEEHLLIESDEVTVTAELQRAEEGVQSLKQDAIDREDYELAQQIQRLQEEFGFDVQS